MNENSEINKIKLEWLGHSCFRIEVANESFYFDPVRKNVVLGTTLEPLKEKKASVIFVSHEHWDHFNAETILALCSPQTKIYCPMDVAGPLSYRMTFEGDSPEELQKLTGQITPVQKEDIIEINDAQVKCLEASEGLSFLIVHEKRKILFMGDSTATDDMIKEEPDIVLFPVWAVKGEEAKLEEFLGLAKESLCIPMHYYNSPDALPQFSVDPQDIQQLFSNKVNMKILEKNRIYVL